MTRCLLTAASTLLLLSLFACGTRRATVPPRDGAAYIQQQLAALDTLAVPDGVPPALWTELTGSLRAQLRARLDSGKTALDIVDSNLSRATLSLDEPSHMLSWSFWSQGDYDQNGEVNIADLTPIAQHFQDSTGGAGSFPPASIGSVVDGDNNGEVNAADITPIAQNLRNILGSYNVYVSTDPADLPASNTGPNGPGATGFATVPLSAATGDPKQGRLSFSQDVGTVPAGAVYWVRPAEAEDGSGADGTPSTAVGPGAPVTSSIAVYQLSFDYGEGLTFDNTDWAQVDVTYSGGPEVLYFNMTLNGTAVLTNVPLVSRVGQPFQLATLPFSLGSASGTAVTTGMAEYSLDPAPKATSADRAASAETSITISPRKVSNVPDGAVPKYDQAPAPAKNDFGRDPAFDGPTVQIAYHTKPLNDYAYGPHEQVASAVADSLSYLKYHFDLPIGTGTSFPIDLATIKQACGPVMNGSLYWGSVLDWPWNKDAYMKANGYPIETRYTTSFEEAFQAMKDDCDVELLIEVDNGLSPGSRYQIVHPLNAMGKLEWGVYLVQYTETTDPGNGWGTTINSTQIGILKPHVANGLDEVRLDSYYGECTCKFVIECPQLGLEWQGHDIYNWGSYHHAIALKSDGDVAVAFRDYFDSQLKFGSLEKNFFLPAPANAIGTIQANTGQTKLKIGEVGSELSIIFQDSSSGDTELKSVRSSDGGETWGTPQLIDSGAGGPDFPGDSIDWFADGGRQFIGYEDFGDFYCVEEQAAGSNTFSAPARVTLPGGPDPAFGKDVQVEEIDGMYYLAYYSRHFGDEDKVRIIRDMDFASGTGTSVATVGANITEYEIFDDGSGGIGIVYLTATTAEYVHSADGLVYDAPVVIDPDLTDPAGLDAALVGGKPAAVCVDDPGGAANANFYPALDALGSAWAADPQLMGKMAKIGGSLNGYLNMLEMTSGEPVVVGHDATGNKLHVFYQK